MRDELGFDSEFTSNTFTFSILLCCYPITLGRVGSVTSALYVVLVSVPWT